MGNLDLLRPKKNGEQKKNGGQASGWTYRTRAQNFSVYLLKTAWALKFCAEKCAIYVATLKLPCFSLEYDFRACLLLCLASYFLFFVFVSSLFFFSLHPGMFFLVSLRLCSSHLLLSASTYFIVRVLSACCVICTLPHLGILMFFFTPLVFFFS